ncbi:NlpC/P60 family protein [Streptosporangium sp. NPDC048047]|uniref:bifunctional WXG100 family type VII secretion target/C40 family peptidase n=1 Tax=Streptosporangium sp. NPDC048047 TaxID=3155748 RepID=UPI00344A3870
MGAVRSLGGERLVALAAKADGNPGEIRAIAKRWRDAATKSAEPFADLDGAIRRKVYGAWHGDSADAFVRYMRAYPEAGNELRDTLRDCANALDDAADAVHTAKSKIDEVCSALLDWHRGNPRATKEQISTAVGRSVTSAEGHVTTAETALSTAKGKIDGYLRDLSSTFGKIAAPAGQEFAPKDGSVDGWIPADRTPVRTTSLASAPGAPPGATAGGAPWSPGGGGGVATADALPYVTGSGTGADIVSAARTHLGKPYVWGANGPRAFDCSGLVYYCLNQAGVKIGDTTAEGYRVSGKPATLPLQPGDVITFGNPATHCGIYIGDGKMIHAPHTGTVVQVANVAGHQPITYRRFT